jgi:hypothetical protein
MFCSDDNAMAAPRKRGGRCDLDGKQAWRPEHQEMTAGPKSPPASKSHMGRILATRRPSPYLGKAEAMREATGTSTSWAAGLQVQASKERLAEITSGRSNSQQGWATTCKDLLHEG